MLFVLFPLPCLNPGQHFKNILLYKIKWTFVLQCVIQTVACTTFTGIVNTKQAAFLSFISFGIFFLLKVYVHFFVYTKIKYLDDGRDFVSWIEFLSIHCSFSVLHCCLSYYVIYNYVTSLAYIIDDYFDGEYKCHRCLVFTYEEWSIIGMLLLFLEMTVYLAYYKDVIFGTFTSLNYIGMYLYQMNPDINIPNA